MDYQISGFVDDVRQRDGSVDVHRCWIREGGSLPACEQVCLSQRQLMSIYCGNQTVKHKHPWLKCRYKSSREITRYLLFTCGFTLSKYEEEVRRTRFSKKTLHRSLWNKANRLDVRQVVPRACQCNEYRFSDEHNTKIGSKEKWKYINNFPARCNTKQSIYCSASSLYMFRMLNTPIIRSTQNCNYSLWYWSYFLCSYLPPMWPSLATLTSTGGDARNHKHKK